MSFFPKKIISEKHSCKQICVYASYGNTIFSVQKTCIYFSKTSVKPSKTRKKTHPKSEMIVKNYFKSNLDVAPNICHVIADGHTTWRVPQGNKSDL